MHPSESILATGMANELGNNILRQQPTTECISEVIQVTKLEITFEARDGVFFVRRKRKRAPFICMKISGTDEAQCLRRLLAPIVRVHMNYDVGHHFNLFEEKIQSK